MMAEYGAAFKNEKVAFIHGWKNHIGPKYAFVGTFMWYASYIIWMVNVGSGIWVVFSNAIFGTDTTSTWSLFGLSSTQTLEFLESYGYLWLLLYLQKDLIKSKRLHQ